ncbi:MAG TPA: hypothetical protein VNA14_12750 [Mycobacteriales bacterium]|nr:hypothetical protein [Mycobacteriales bacterium]
MISRFRRTAAMLAMVVFTTAGLSACGDDDDGANTAATPTAAATSASPIENAVTITGVDYGYTLDKPAVDSGSAKISFVNGGQDAHMVAIGQIAAGKTLADVNAALKSEDEKDDEAVLPSFGDEDAGPFGTPQVLSPGSRAATWVDLKPGTYALICFFPTADGKSHYEVGMLNQLVVNATPTTAPAPTPTGEATLADDKLTFPDLSSGKAVLKVTNTGTKTHDFTIVSPAAGKTFDQTIAVVDNYFQGKAKAADLAGVFQGGMSHIKPGTSTFVEIDLRSGTYFVICTESDVDGDSKEHFRLNGEKGEFKVA